VALPQISLVERDRRVPRRSFAKEGSRFLLKMRPAVAFHLFIHSSDLVLYFAGKSSGTVILLFAPSTNPLIHYFSL
jgi:hypothetical protein